MTVQRDVIAVVDDDPALLKALGRLLSAYGYRAELFGSAADFLKAAATSEAACFVVDVQLGRDSGVDLAHRLAAMNITSPIIFITGSDNNTIQRQAIEFGCVAYLRKPFTAEQLIEAIEKAVGPTPPPG